MDQNCRQVFQNFYLLSFFQSFSIINYNCEIRLSVSAIFLAELKLIKSYWKLIKSYQILSDTYQILSDTYQILLGTYQILSETYQILLET